MTGICLSRGQCRGSSHGLLLPGDWAPPPAPQAELCRAKQSGALSGWKNKQQLFLKRARAVDQATRGDSLLLRPPPSLTPVTARGAVHSDLQSALGRGAAWIPHHHRGGEGDLPVESAPGPMAPSFSHPGITASVLLGTWGHRDLGCGGLDVWPSPSGVKIDQSPYQEEALKSKRLKVLRCYCP